MNLYNKKNRAGIGLIGAMIMAMISNALNILGVSSYWQQVFIGSSYCSSLVR
tara:strand:- start:1676 stop:1831 length:156 start_codon:yes stop_codon:yes gene_type:complete